MTWLLKTISETPIHAGAVELPQRYAEASVEGIGNESCKALATEYLSQFYDVADKGIGILLVGRSGTWKTYTCCAIARLVYRIPLKVRFVSCAVELMELARNKFDGRTADKLWQMKTTPLVVMDDFTMVPPASTAHEMLNEIAEYRFGNELPTLWTGNVGAQGLKEVMGEIASMYGPGFSRRLYHGSDGFRLRIV